MAVKHVDLDDRYIPKTSDSEISVRVVIGDGQKGSYSIFLGKTLISVNKKGKLGTKAAIGTRNTIISATVVDTLKQTNWTSMTVFVEENGQTTKYGPYSVQAEKHLDTIIYSLKLVHK